MGYNITFLAVKEELGYNILKKGYVQCLHVCSSCCAKKRDETPQVRGSKLVSEKRSHVMVLCLQKANPGDNHETQLAFANIRG
jgi:hypothetical protein